MRVFQTHAIIAIAATIFLSACTEDAPVNAPTANAKVVQTQEISQSTTPAVIASDVVAPIGIAECDEFLQKYEACMAKMDPKNRDSYRENLVSFQEQFKELSADPAVRPMLQQRCRSDQEELSKSMIADFGCEF